MYAAEVTRATARYHGRLDSFVRVRRPLFIRSLAAACGLASALAAAPALAHPGDVAKLRRIFIDFETLYWVGKVTLPRNSEPLRINTDAIGIFGYPRIPWGLGFSYAPSDWWIVGGRLDASIEPQTIDDVRTITFHGTLRPFVEILFMRERNVRPFFMARAGLGVSRTFERVEGERALESVGPATINPSLGVGLGTHVFMDDDLSIDAAVTLDHRWNFRRAHDENGNPLAAEVQGSYTVRDSSLIAAITIGFSRWF